MAEFRSWISSLSLWASSCSWALSCCILLMYSAVFCSVVALLICASRQGDYMSAIHQTFNITMFINKRCVLLAFASHIVFQSNCASTKLLFGDALRPRLSAHLSLMQLHIFSQYLYAWLRAERCHKIMQSVKTQFDVETPLLLCRDVSYPPGLRLLQTAQHGSMYITLHTQIHEQSVSYIHLFITQQRLGYSYIQKSDLMPSCPIWKQKEM